MFSQWVLLPSLPPCFHRENIEGQPSLRITRLLFVDDVVLAMVFIASLLALGQEDGRRGDYCPKQGSSSILK